LNDYHIDSTTEYAYNEVAVDYNAAFVGALAGLYKYYGQGHEPIPNFPPLEPEPTIISAKQKLSVKLKTVHKFF